MVGSPRRVPLYSLVLPALGQGMWVWEPGPYCSSSDRKRDTFLLLTALITVPCISSLKDHSIPLPHFHVSRVGRKYPQSLIDLPKIRATRVLGSDQVQRGHRRDGRLRSSEGATSWRLME